VRIQVNLVFFVVLEKVLNDRLCIFKIGKVDLNFSQLLALKKKELWF